MNIGTILSKALQISWREKLLWLFAAIPYFFVLPLMFLATPTYTGNYAAFSEQETMRMLSQTFFMMGWTCLAVVASLFAGPLSLGGMISGINRAAQGVPLKFKEILQDVRRSYWRVLLLPLIVGVATFLIMLFAIIAISVMGAQLDQDQAIFILIPLCGLLCIFFPIMWFAGFVTSFAITAMVVDDLRVSEALTEAWMRIRNNLGKVIGIFILITLIPAVLSILMNMATGGIQFMAMSTVDFSSPESFLALYQAWWLKLLVIPQYLVMIFLTIFYTSGTVLAYLALKPPAPEIVEAS